MKFTFSWEGERYPIEAPSQWRQLTGYMQAIENLKAVRKGEERPHEGEVHEIRSQRPRQLLGHLSLVRFIRDAGLKRLGSGREVLGNDELITSWGPERRTHHVALMRNAELVVRYLEGPSLPTDLLEYAGVFIPDDGVDDAFARSEPPTHDDWQPKMLDDRREATFVNVAMREIKTFTREFAAPLNGGFRGGAQVPLGAAATFLGGLVPALDAGAPTTGGMQPGGGGGGGGGSRRRRGGSQAAIEVLDDGQLESVGDFIGVRFRFRVKHAEGGREATVRVIPEVLINEGASVEKEAPEGDDTPRVLRWESDEGDVIENVEKIVVSVAKAGSWSVLLSVPEDAMIRASFVAESIEGE